MELLLLPEAQKSRPLPRSFLERVQSLCKGKRNHVCSAIIREPDTAIVLRIPQSLYSRLFAADVFDRYESEDDSFVMLLPSPMCSRVHVVHTVTTSCNDSCIERGR